LNAQSIVADFQLHFGFENSIFIFNKTPETQMQRSYRILTDEAKGWMVGKVASSAEFGDAKGPGISRWLGKDAQDRGAL
jgi:hypothetical protein